MGSEAFGVSAHKAMLPAPASPRLVSSLASNHSTGEGQREGRFQARPGVLLSRLAPAHPPVPSPARGRKESPRPQSRSLKRASGSGTCVTGTYTPSAWAARSHAGRGCPGPALPASWGLPGAFARAEGDKPRALGGQLFSPGDHRAFWA